MILLQLLRTDEVGRPKGGLRLKGEGSLKDSESLALKGLDVKEVESTRPSVAFCNMDIVVSFC